MIYSNFQGFIVDDIRKSDEIYVLEQVIGSYVPSSNDIPLLINDLENVVKEMRIFIEGAPSLSGQSFIQGRESVAAKFYPHQLVMKKMTQYGTANLQGFSNYLPFYNQAERIFSNMYTIDPSSTAWNNNVSDMSNLLSSISKFVMNPFSPVTDTIKESMSSMQNISEKILKAASDAAKKLPEASQSFLEMIVKYGIVFMVGWIIFNKLTNKILDNPLLMTVNPPNPDIDRLYSIAKRNGIEKTEFDRALNLFLAQHKRLPKIITIETGKLPSVLVEVGKVTEIIYDPPTGSRKKPYVYRHKMENTKLVTDSKGKFLVLLGNTYMDSCDGWLKK